MPTIKNNCFIVNDLHYHPGENNNEENDLANKIQNAFNQTTIPTPTITGSNQNLPLINELQQYSLTQTSQDLTLPIDQYNITIHLQAQATTWFYPDNTTQVTLPGQNPTHQYTQPGWWDPIIAITYWTGTFTHPKTGQNIPLNGYATTTSQSPTFRIFAYPVTLTNPNK